MSNSSQQKDKKLPLDNWHQAQGARMVSFAGYSMPIQYEEGIMAEHLWVRDNAGLFDVSHMGQAVLTGDNCDAEFEKIVPGEIVKLGLNRLRYTLLLSQKGGILDDLMVTRREKDIYIVVNGATKFEDFDYMRESLGHEVGITHLDGRALLALQLKAGEVMHGLIPELKTLYFMQAGQFELDGMSLWISRSGYTGEDGFEISIASDDVQKLADMLIADERVKPIGLGARNSLRLEAGLPLYGHDLDETITPVQAGLNFALNKRRREEAEFAGADRIMKEYPDKSNLVRVGLFVEGRQPVREGSLIVDEKGFELGRVTSGGFSPSLQKPIAMAYVPRELSEVGTKLTARQRRKDINVTVTAMPFIPAKYYRAPK